MTVIWMKRMLQDSLFAKMSDGNADHPYVEHLTVNMSTDIARAMQPTWLKQGAVARREYGELSCIQNCFSNKTEAGVLRICRCMRSCDD